MQRYFAIDQKEDEFILEKDDYYHIKTVMRMKPNERVEVVYIGKTYIANIDNDYKIMFEKEILEEQDLIYKRLMIPLLKEQKMDFILQKATELGVNEIVLYKSKRSIIPFEVKEKRKMERWLKICKEASEQSKRQTIPSITIADLKMIKELDGLKLICSTVESENNLKKVLQSNQKCAKINVVVGPEGGFDPKEEQDFIKLGFIPVTLGKTILRVETVPIVFLGIVNYEFME